MKSVFPAAHHHSAEFQQKQPLKYSHNAENEKSALQLRWNMI